MAVYNPYDPTNGYQPVAAPQPAGQPTPGGLPGQTGAVTTIGQTPAAYAAQWDPNSQGQIPPGIQQALSQGLSGQAAVDFANQNTPGGGYAYRADTGTYSLPGGGYVGKNGGGQYFMKPGDSVGGATPTSMSVDPAYLQPFGSQAQLGGSFGASPPQYQAPPAFQAPTAQSILDNPGYTFSRDQAIGALQNTKAAQGVYNSGGTVNDIASLASNFAAQNYNNIWNQDFNLWNQNTQNALSGNSANLQDYQNARDTYYANQSNPFSKLLNVAQLGATTATTAG